MRHHFQRGISLIELIMFIVIVSVALAGILLVMNVTTRSSADPLIHKQALAIAESLLEEVELMPFTFCDPDDPVAGLASTVDITACTAPAGGEAIGPEAVETRYAVPQYDNVNDYNGFIMNAGNGGIKDITFPINPAIAALSGYSASVVVTAQTFSGIAALDVNGAPQALLITVTVTGPDNIPVVIEGMRTRYAPRTLP